MFSFSVESVLLPHFASINNRVQRIMDVGTNNALIPLILATKTKAMITGVEIEGEACRLAVKNVHVNGKADQIKIVHADVLTLPPPSPKFNLIICNPPFFSLTSNYHQQHHQRFKQTARHEIKLSLDALLTKAKTLISHRGYLVLCHRTDRLAELLHKTTMHHFEPKRIQFIHPKVNVQAKTFMLECRFQAGQGLRVLKPIVCHNRNNTFKRAVRRFYRP